MSITSRYHVTGMTCGRCVAHVKEEIQEISGVSEVELTVAGDMTIISDAELAFADVEAAVSEAGDYTVSAVD
ncbi:MAG: cation transporter [Propionibacteriaceae bacterium]|nr:cation transporter [Propionibacteriaceae bacterium]